MPRKKVKDSNAVLRDRLKALKVRMEASDIGTQEWKYYELLEDSIEELETLQNAVTALFDSMDRQVWEPISRGSIEIEVEYERR